MHSSIPVESPKPSGEVRGLFFQLPIPGVPVTDQRLRELAEAQREWLAAWERYESLRVQMAIERAVPALLMRQAE